MNLLNCVVTVFVAGLLLQVQQGTIEQVHLKYDTESSIMTIQGVCEANSDSIACWLPNGQPSDELTSRVQASISKDKQLPSIPLTLGKKVRLVIYEIKTNNNIQSSGFEVLSSTGRDDPNWKHTLRTEHVTEGDENSSTYTQMRCLVGDPRVLRGHFF